MPPTPNEAQPRLTDVPLGENARPTGDSTAAVHAGEPRQRAYHAITTPIAASATYTFADTAALIDYHEGRIEREEYGRYGNPTTRTVEAKLAALEAGGPGTAAAVPVRGLRAPRRGGARPR